MLAIVPEIGDTFESYLLSRGIVTNDSLARAKRAQQSDTDRLTAILVKLGILAEKPLAEALAAHTGFPLVTAKDFPAQPLRAPHFSQGFLREAIIAPIASDANGVTVAMADPLDASTLEAVRYAAGSKVFIKVALASDIVRHLDLVYQEQAAQTNQLVANFDGSDEQARTDDFERLKDLASEAPVIRLVNRWIESAVEMRASDIHLEPSETSLRVCFRIDGALRVVDQLPARIGPSVSSRIKILARLNIAERRLPQDGKFRIPVRGREIDFRVSVVPTVHGEGIVLRILDRGHISLSFDALGYDAAMLDRYFSVLKRPNGILLITGPTGSGKTTTLYTSLVEIRTPELKILTVEDPVEYQLEGVNQTQVQPQIGLTFAAALRSFLRHDPDVILVGEIRDVETARIAVQAALTGHLVLSTLHTNDAVSAINRLMDMGVDDYLIASTINGVVGQRLVRRLCACREPYDAPAELLQRFDLRASPEPPLFYRAVGCERCDHKGYAGRTAIAETLVMTETMRSLVMRHAPREELHQAGLTGGMESMQLNGLRKCLSGETTVEEVYRVVGDIGGF